MQTVAIQPGDNSADFAMAETFIYYMWLNLPSLLLGALMTLLLTCVAVFDGIVIGTLAGVARVVHNKVLNLIAGIYVDFIRGTPLLVQIFMIHLRQQRRWIERTHFSWLKTGRVATRSRNAIKKFKYVFCVECTWTEQ